MRKKNSSCEILVIKSIAVQKKEVATKRESNTSQNPGHDSFSVDLDSFSLTIFSALQERT